MGKYEFGCELTEQDDIYIVIPRVYNPLSDAMFKKLLEFIEWFVVIVVLMLGR